MASTWPSSATSTRTANAEPSAQRPTVSSAAARSTSATQTRAPSAVKTSAATRPMPPPAPVITHTFPSSRGIRRVPPGTHSPARPAPRRGAGPGPPRVPPPPPHTRSKARQVLPLLGMPEDADGEPPLAVLDRLGGAVVRVRDDVEAVTDVSDPLVVVRLHARRGADQRAELALRLDRHVVRREEAGRDLVLVV